MAEVEWEIQQIIKFEKKPVDIVMSVNGSYLFVLTDDGIIHVYDSEANLKGIIEAGKNIDSLACGLDEHLLIIKSKKDREVRKITFDFLQEIDTEGSPYIGNKNASVVISVFSDYQCPYCEKLMTILDQVIENNKDTVKVVIKNFPLPSHKYARKAAAAALAADMMGKFQEFQDELYKNTNQLNDRKVFEIAKNLGLDPAAFEKEMKSKKIQDQINRDIQDGKNAGVKGTPSVFINGKQLKNRSFYGFQDAINEELKKKK